MASVQVITQVKYYSIDNSLNIQEHATFHDAKVSTDLKFILRHNIGHNPFTTNAGTVIPNFAANIEMLNEDESIHNIYEEKNWKLELASFGFEYGYHYTTMWVRFTDSFGFSTQAEKFGISAAEFVKAYKRFSALNQYDGYKYASLAIKNTELTEENTKLKEKVEFLNNELSQLRNRLSAMA